MPNQQYPPQKMNMVNLTTGSNMGLMNPSITTSNALQTEIDAYNNSTSNISGNYCSQSGQNNYGTSSREGGSGNNSALKGVSYSDGADEDSMGSGNSNLLTRIKKKDDSTRQAGGSSIYKLFH